MIQIIVFSFNRAMQLDTLLSSLIAYWEKPEYKIDVVYNYSSKSFGDAYEQLSRDFKGQPVEFHRENTSNPDHISFTDLLCVDNLVRLIRQPKLRKPKSDFRGIVKKILKKTDALNVMFLTDDSMFVSSVNIKDHDINWINNNPKQRQFSLRLGRGVSTLPSTIVIEGDYCHWDMYQNDRNWGYPFSVDAHIYNRDFLLELVEKYLFINPSSLEMNIVGSVRRRKLLSQGTCYTDIKMLTFPINIVQSSVDNVSQNVSVEMLNKRFLNGERLKYVVEKEYNATKQYVRQIEFTDVNGHKSILSISDELTRPNADLSTLSKSVPGGGKNEISIIIAGDYSPKERFQNRIDDNEWQGLLPGVEDLLLSADYSVVNFESTIAERSDSLLEKIGSHLKTGYPSMYVLKSLGFNMITLANNHSLDYGSEALQRTIKEANQLGIECVGAGGNLNEARRPKLIRIKDKTITIINCCEQEFSIATDTEAGANPLDVVEIARQIKEAKEKTDVVLLIIHGGVEHYQLPTPRMKKVYRYFVECGADAIVNHHQHCFSGYEYYKSKPICYGIGNFCFDSESDNKLRHATWNYGYLLKLYFKGSGEIGIETLPYEQSYLKPGVYLINERTEFDKRLAELNEIISNDERLEEFFYSMSRTKQDSYIGILRPYSNRVFQALNVRGLFPSFVCNATRRNVAAKINCESHLEILRKALL